MPFKKPYLGIDLGASSGRAVLGFIDGGVLELEEIHRFVNEPVEIEGTLCWDFPSLWSNIIQSLNICAQKGHIDLDGIGVDTWGVDFGLLDASGELLRQPVHYRDERAANAEKIFAQKMDNETLYRLAGFPFGCVSTLAQLIAINASSENNILKDAETLLMMPDLFRYFLCGHKACERTIASSSLLLNVNSGEFCLELFDTFGLPRELLPELILPGVSGVDLSGDIAKETGMNRAPVIAIAGHDTACAAAAVPIVDADTLFISCGTWSVFGIMTEKAILSDAALQAGFINEYGLDNILFVKNMMGLYLFEKLYRALARKGNGLSYEQMVDEAAQAGPFTMFLDINSPLFFAADDPESAVAQYLKQSGQSIIPTTGQTIRALLEGLAFSYKQALSDLEKVTGGSFETISVVGGGIRNQLLCRFTADATGLKVVAGPAEATIAGNIGTQAIAIGELSGPAAIRELVRNSFELKEYSPQNSAQWEQNFSVYKEITQNTIK